MTTAAGATNEAGRPADAARVLLVGALQPHAGKTALVAALSVALASTGQRMLALRLRGAAESANEQLDAGYFQTLPFARGRGGSAVDAEAAGRAAEEQGRAGGLLMLEAPGDADLAQLADQLDAAVIVAVRSADAVAMKALGELTQKLGDRLVGVV